MHQQRTNETGCRCEAGPGGRTQEVMSLHPLMLPHKVKEVFWSTNWGPQKRPERGQILSVLLINNLNKNADSKEPAGRRVKTTEGRIS